MTDNICVIGINHKTAAIDIREQFFLNEIQRELLLSEFKSSPSIIESFVISTCNRTEVYLKFLPGFSAFAEILESISRIKKINNPLQFRNNFYKLSGFDAVEHLFKVSAGLDSLMLGEKQILGQVKESVEKARERGMLGKHFNLLTNLAIRTGKKAQAETQISFGGSSISWAAITKAQEILGTLNEKSILIIGAGKMGELTAGQLANKGLRKLFLMNRTHENACQLALKYGGKSVPFCDIKDILTEVDVCLCSIGAPHYIIEQPLVDKIMSARRGKPLVLFDISMPRNIDPAISQIPEVLLYEIDDLNQVVDANMRIRESAVPLVNKIISAKLTQYQQKLAKLQTAFN